MDFDKIKSNWQDSFNSDRLSDEQISIAERVKSKSDPVFKKIMRNYTFSLISLLLMYAMIIFALFIFLDSTMVYLLAFLITVLLGFGAGFSIKSLWEIKKSLSTNQSVRTSLENTIRIMERSLRFGMGNIYKFLLIPLALIFGIIIGIYIGSGDQSFLETIYSLENKSLIKIILVVVLGSAVTIPLSQTMIKKMYKQHYEELKKCLCELDENET